MTVSEFNKLDIKDKGEALFVPKSKAVFIDERIIYNKYIIKIYALNYFFVEVWVTVKDPQIEKIFALEKEEDWQGYLKSINLSDLI